MACLLHPPTGFSWPELAPCFPRTTIPLPPFYGYASNVSLFRELRRRNVFRVATAYVVTAWLVIQVVETILPAFGFGDTAVRYVTIAFVIGLVPVLVLSWVFEITPEGLKRDADAGPSGPGGLKSTKRLDRMILVVLAIALGYFAFDKFVLAPQQQAAQQQRQAEQLALAKEEARQEGRTEAVVESYGDKSIAVLPFRDMSPEGDQEYLSDGIAEELLNLLSRVPGLRVTSRTSSFAFKEQTLDVPEIARRLKVGVVGNLGPHPERRVRHSGRDRSGSGGFPASKTARKPASGPVSSVFRNPAPRP